MKNPSEYTWIHLEGRNVQSVIQMVKFVRSSDPMRRITLSMELEKPKPNLDELLEQDIDLFFIAKDYAKSRGLSDAKTAAQYFGEQALQHTSVIVPWGEEVSSTQ